MIYPKNITRKTLPTIISREIVAQSNHFSVERQELEFSNGQQATYEKLRSGTRGSVLIVAVNKHREALLIREYNGGKECYELAFPKGKIEEEESTEAAACRELQEETGYASKSIKLLKTVSVAPGYMAHQSHIFLAENIHWEPLNGDEPEPIECFFWPLKNIEKLIQRTDFTEARSIVAFYLAKNYCY